MAEKAYIKQIKLQEEVDFEAIKAELAASKVDQDVSSLGEVVKARDSEFVTYVQENNIKITESLSKKLLAIKQSIIKDDSKEAKHKKEVIDSLLVNELPEEEVPEENEGKKK